MVCFARFGVGKTTLDDVAREAGVSRATVYRAFPGGRDAVFHAAVSREIDRFFAELAGELDRHDDLEDLLVAGVGAALRFLHDHEALGTVVSLEPQLLVPQFAFQGLDPLVRQVTDFATPYLRPHVGGDADVVAEQVIRLVLSYTLHPSDRLDPHDDGSVRRLVRRELLPAAAE